MRLEARIVARAPEEAVIAVDGAFEARGLHLSHWPGNRTPAALRHELSTGSALAFAALPAEERAALAGGARLVVNNHYDTDGVCAAFALCRPAEALARREALLEAAAAGDFFRVPSERAVAIDALVEAFADPERSPLDLAGLDDHRRWSRAQEELHARLAAWLDGELEPWRALWEPAVRAVRRDRADLARLAGEGRREDVAALDLVVWSAPLGARSSRGAPRFDPGRHALFGASEADRALVVGPGEGGTTYRLVVSTLSWFDLPSRARLPRPDLEALARALDRLEGSESAAPLAWRAQPATNASPELWFGRAELPCFAEHNDALAPSALAPERVLRAVREALAR